MELRHECELKTSSGWSDIPVACDGQYLALPQSKTVVSVWSIDDLTSKPIQLIGHHTKITAICLGQYHFPKLLSSASDDYIIVWDINKATYNHELGETIRGTIVGRSLGVCQCVSLGPDNSVLAAGILNDVLILTARSEKILATLEGHLAMVTCVEFCPHYTSTVVSISEDRTFKVWDVSEFSLVYQSSIVSASPFISMAMNPNQEQVAIGTTDGQLRVYDLTDKNAFRCLHHLDVDKIVTKRNQDKLEMERLARNIGPVTVSSLPSWQRDVTPDNLDDLSEDNMTERGCAILGLCYSHKRELEPNTAKLPEFLQRENTVIRDILSWAPVLFVATSTGLLQLNAFTLELVTFTSLLDPVPVKSSADVANTSKVLSTVGCLHLAINYSNEVLCVAESLFEGMLHVLSLHVAEITKTISTSEHQEEATLSTNLYNSLAISEDGSTTEISFLSSVPLTENSLLKAELIPKKKDEAKNKEKAYGSVLSVKKRSKCLTDQPLTFKSKVKSSGYCTAPRKTMFHPQTNITKGSSPIKKSALSIADRIVCESYPENSSAPIHLQSTQNVAERPTSINTIRFSGDGQSLVCGLGNKAVQEFKMPLTGKGTAYTGHNGIIQSVCYSHSNNHIISSSEDLTVKVWVKGQPEPILTIDQVDNNFSSEIKPGTAGTKVSSFARDVKFGQFYYLDKFILLASGNRFYMYKYHLDLTKEEIKRYLTKSRYKLVKSFQLEKAQTVTQLKAVNSFHSYITMVAGSDRSLSLYDINTGQVCRVMDDIHCKPCHSIALNEGSSAVSHPANVYDLFATAAMTDCIKLWDIRTNRCVRRYEGHLNRCYPCGLSLSPCGRFIATGAEDKAAYIYDLRSGTYLHKLTGHTDVISDVQFHPIKPQMATACLDGKVRLYIDTG